MLKRELPIFLVVGLITVVIDFLLYRSIVLFGLQELTIAKTLGFLGGTLFAYIANRFWTFSKKDIKVRNFGRFLLVYITGLCVNVSVNSLGIIVFSFYMDTGPHHIAIYISFLLATLVSATLNFIGMKYFVFSEPSKS